MPPSLEPSGSYHFISEKVNKLLPLINTLNLSILTLDNKPSGSIWLQDIYMGIESMAQEILNIIIISMATGIIFSSPLLELIWERLKLPDLIKAL